MPDDIVTEKELKDIVNQALEVDENRYGVSTGIEDDGFEVYITYEDVELPSIGRPLDEIRERTGLDGDYNLRADFRPEDSAYIISVTRIDD